jgi:4,5-dihydroxyphthalate decarboxylase
MSSKIRLSLAVSDYDHVRDFTSGKVTAQGIEIVPIELTVEEIFHRTLTYGEFDVSEISTGQFLARFSRGDTAFTAIPVFPSRIFRHSCIFVLRDGGINRPQDLAGKRIGVPQWSQTASIYARGLLAHEYGVALDGVEWVQAGIYEPGRVETAPLDLPRGIRLTPVPDKTLTEMLLSGEIAALISAREPAPFLAGDPRIVRLFTDFAAAEAEYFRTTGIFPIMHTIVVRTSLLETDPWIARNLYSAFDEARRRGARRVLDGSISRFALPWSEHYAHEAAKVLGDDPFAYGIEPNRKTLEAFVTYAREQGVSARSFPIEELFAPQLQGEHKV